MRSTNMVYPAQRGSCLTSPSIMPVRGSRIPKSSSRTTRGRSQYLESSEIVPLSPSTIQPPAAANSCSGVSRLPR